MNLTPNSFSDGGELTHLSALKHRMAQWGALDDQGLVVFDWGALSTAPKNAHADNQSADDEWNRMSLMLPLLPSLKTVSIDSYRLDVLNKCLQDANEQQSWIWNDVSGKLDEAALSLLNEYPQMSYILCHNLAPDREATPFHLDYTVAGDDFFYHVLSWFAEKIELYQKSGLKNPLYLDPCFGFSKNYRQNWELIDRFEEFASTFVDYPLVIGISRKSFLRDRYLVDHPRDQTLARSELNLKLDQYQENWHVWFDQILSQPCFFRMHQPPLSLNL